jgi:hypothetical protein
MILEAFSEILHQEWVPDKRGARDILHDWLLHHLQAPRANTHVTAVIQAEICYLAVPNQLVFFSESPTGVVLLNSMYDYCDSYEQWQFSRFLHHLKSSVSITDSY